MQKCPQCAEKIQPRAKVCRYCHYALTPEQQADADMAANIGTVVKVLSSLVLLYLVVQCVADMPQGTGTGISGARPASPVIPAATVRLDRFSWQAYGDRYCHAHAKITNTSPVPLHFLKLTMQFAKGSSVVDSSFSYAELQALAAGQSTTWTDMYPCPGKDVTLDLTATAQEGAVALAGPG